MSHHNKRVFSAEFGGGKNGEEESSSRASGAVGSPQAEELSSSLKKEGKLSIGKKVSYNLPQYDRQKNGSVIRSI
jgi:hypothetical protein